MREKLIPKVDNIISVLDEKVKNRKSGVTYGKGLTEKSKPIAPINARKEAAKATGIGENTNQYKTKLSRN